MAQAETPLPENFSSEGRPRYCAEAPVAAGKDVVWVPTPQPTVDAMLDMAKLTKADFLVDLGSGDGITVITAAKRGARAMGVEFNPDMVALAQKRAEEAGMSARAKFVQGDFFKTDFSQANVLTMFLLPSLNEQLRPTILNMKPGTRVVTNTFRMGSGEDEWLPEAQKRVGPSSMNEAASAASGSMPMYDCLYMNARSRVPLIMSKT